MYQLRLLLAFLVICEVISQQYYNVDSNLAYQWGRGYPQSCSCAETGVALSECSLFNCNCICDVTAGKCDYNCCCDPDCSSEQVSRFESLSACSVEGIPDIVQYCYNENQLSKINPHGSMTGTSTSKIGVENALCIEKRNILPKTEFFEDVSTVGVSVFSTSEGQKPYDYIEIDTTYAIDGIYDQNDTMPVFNIDKTTGSISNVDGTQYLQQPAADFTGSCNDNSFATFENDVMAEKNACERSISTIISSNTDNFANVLADWKYQCEVLLSVSKYVTDLSIGINPNVGTSTVPASISNVVNVTLNSITYKDYFTSATSAGSLSDWNSNDCATAFFDNYFTYITSACRNSFTNTLAPTNGNIEVGTPICMGIVQAVTYNIHHDQSSSANILKITADVVVMDIPLISNNTIDSMIYQIYSNRLNTSFNNMVEVDVSFAQNFGVSYFDLNEGIHSSLNGNLDNRTRSGNPGYIMGSNILYGSTQLSYDSSTKKNVTIVNEYVAGMLMPSVISTISQENINSNNGLVMCPNRNILSYSSNYSATTNIQFGYDVATGCVLSLNRTELKNLCSTTSVTTAASAFGQYINDTTGLPYFIDFIPGVVGIFGNADPLDSTQWIAIDEITTSTIMTNLYTRSVKWDDTTNTCTGFPNGLNIMFLVAYTGEKQNAQNKIVSAGYEYSSRPWKMKLPRYDNSSTQTFPISLTVSFVFKQQQELVGYHPPPPPLLFEVPYDVFYPFVASSASQSISSNSYQNSVISSVTLIYICVCIVAIMIGI